MMTLCCELLEKLGSRSLATAESLTGGGIGAAITAVPGSSRNYKGGIISYCDEAKHRLLGVPEDILREKGAVSPETAQAMAAGARALLKADFAVSVTGLAGPAGDDFGNPVGTVCIGFSSAERSFARVFRFSGGREQIRSQTISAALEILSNQL